MEGIVFNIRRYSVQDGPGIRTTVFLKGCPLQCLWCHNPESQSFQPEIYFQSELCIHCGHCIEACPHDMAATESCLLCGACIENCPTEAREWVGAKKNTNELMQVILKDRLFYDESEGGVTFSGGEPLSQPDFLLDLLHACGSEGIHRALDTSGYAPWSVLEQISTETDLFLFDLKVMDPLEHLKYTGVENELILQNLRKLMEMGKRGVIRMPLIPGVNNSANNLKAMADFLLQTSTPWFIQILPYHHMQIGKYQKMGRPYLLPELSPPSGEQVQAVLDYFLSRGLKAEQI